MLQIIEMNHISWILMVYTHTEIIFSCCNFSKTCQIKYQSNMKRICIFPNNMHYLFLFPICDRDIIFFVLTCQLLYLTYKLTNKYHSFIIICEFCGFCKQNSFNTWLLGYLFYTLYFTRFINRYYSSVVSKIDGE